MPDRRLARLFAVIKSRSGGRGWSVFRMARKFQVWGGEKARAAQVRAGRAPY